METKDIEGSITRFAKRFSETVTRYHIAALCWSLDAGACIRCAFSSFNQYFPWEKYILYECDEILMGVANRLRETFKDLPNDTPPIEEKIKGHCSKCFGILPLVTSGAFKENLLAQIEASDYQFDDCVVSVSLPSSLLIRHYSHFYFLQEKCGPQAFLGTDTPSMMEIKEIAKILIIKTVETKYTYNTKSLFSVIVNGVHPETANDYLFLEKANKKGFHMPKKKIAKVSSKSSPSEASAKAVTTALQSISRSKFIEEGQYPPRNVQEASQVDITFSHTPLLLAGRYLKFSRDLSQSEWVVNGSRVTEHSVEEIIGDVLLPIFQAKEYSFQTAGREDSDVKMLGTGRPFVLTLVDPHRVRFSPEEISQMTEAVNHLPHLAKVRDLRLASKEDSAKIKEGEQTKKKTYRCVVWVEREISEKDLEVLHQLKDVKVFQKTPLRVLHRRSMATRERVVHQMECQLLNSHYFVMDLVTQAGTYIKEFVHGDFGRSSPSLGTLLKTKADILQLDVLEIDM